MDKIEGEPPFSLYGGYFHCMVNLYEASEICMLANPEKVLEFFSMEMDYEETCYCRA
jgi:hypothetical protein